MGFLEGGLLCFVSKKKKNSADYHDEITFGDLVGCESDTGCARTSPPQMAKTFSRGVARHEAYFFVRILRPARKITGLQKLIPPPPPPLAEDSRAERQRLKIQDSEEDNIYIGEIARRYMSPAYTFSEPIILRGARISWDRRELGHRCA